MTLHVPKAGNIKYALSGDHPFVAKINPGETAVVECAINANDGTIRAVGQQLTPEDVAFPFVNGATGPIEIVGAKKGDMLSVEILDMKLDTWASPPCGPASACFPIGCGRRSSATRPGSWRSRTASSIGATS